MKQLISGIIIMFLTPFTVIFGWWLLNHFNVPDGPRDWASFFGLLSLTVNYGIGIALVIQGHTVLKTFELKH